MVIILNGIFEPKVVKKYENNISSIEDKILSMYAKGKTPRDIQDHIKDIYGFDASPSLVSKITDKSASHCSTTARKITTKALCACLYGCNPF